jgi:transcriptional regulator with XRE-family HTH domain
MLSLMPLSTASKTSMPGAGNSNQATRLAALRRKTDYSLRDLEAMLRAAGVEVGITYSQLAKLEKDPTVRIRHSVLTELARIYQTTTDYIENGTPPSRSPFNKMPPRIVTTDNLGKPVILKVPIPAQAGYMQHVGDQTYLGELKGYSLPGFEQGVYRMFEVKGNSMEPTFYEGDWVVGSHVEEAASIKNNDIYIVVTRDGICIKRVINEVDRRGVLIINSDNPDYTPDVIFAEDVLEMWAFELKLTSRV